MSHVVLAKMPIAPMCPAGKCDEVQEIIWSRLQCDTAKLLPKIPHNASLHLEPDTKALASSIPDADIPKEARTKLQELLNEKYLQIIFQKGMDISSANLVKLDIPTESRPITSKLYTIFLKYSEFVDHEYQYWSRCILICPREGSQHSAQSLP